MLGANDLLQGANPETTAARMEVYLKQLPIEKEKILLISPPPMKLGVWVTGKSPFYRSQSQSLRIMT